VSDPSGSPSRYNRTVGGLIGSMIVTVLVVVAFVLVRAVLGSDDEVRPTTVDYSEAVSAARDAGIQVAYPISLPQGWDATSVTFEPGPRPKWGLGILTEDGLFAGVQQQDDSLEDLLRTFVDEEPTQGEDVTVDSALGTTWSTWSDDGGDHAYAAEVPVGGGDTETVLVYGSASTAELRTLLESLTLS
jgi:hypothetical protein